MKEAILVIPYDKNSRIVDAELEVTNGQGVVKK